MVCTEKVTHGRVTLLKTSRPWRFGARFFYQAKIKGTSQVKRARIQRHSMPFNATKRSSGGDCSKHCDIVGIELSALPLLLEILDIKWQPAEMLMSSFEITKINSGGMRRSRNDLNS